MAGSFSLSFFNMETTCSIPVSEKQDQSLILTTLVLEISHSCRGPRRISPLHCDYLVVV
jgi:hypothetical protein